MTRTRENRARFFSGSVPDWYAPGTEPELIDWTIRQILDSATHVDGHYEAFATYDPRPDPPGLRVPIHYIRGELDAAIP